MDKTIAYSITADPVNCTGEFTEHGTYRILSITAPQATVTFNVQRGSGPILSETVVVARGSTYMKTQWSIDGSTSWHDTFATGDLYMRQSADGGATWGPASRVVGETGTEGQFTDFRYQKNTSAITAPAYTAGADNPGASWLDAPATTGTGEYNWMIQADWRGSTRLTSWSTPVRITGDVGSSGIYPGASDLYEAHTFDSLPDITSPNLPANPSYEQLAQVFPVTETGLALDLRFTDVPAYPDGTALYVEDEWLTASGWTYYGGAGALTVGGGVATITNPTTGAYINRPISGPTSGIIILRVKQSAGVFSALKVNLSGTSVVENYSSDFMSGEFKTFAFIWTSGALTSVDILASNYLSESSTIEIDWVYIGDGTYDHQVVDSSPSNLLLTDIGAVPVPGPNGYTALMFSGSSHLLTNTSLQISSFSCFFRCREYGSSGSALVSNFSGSDYVLLGDATGSYADESLTISMGGTGQAYVRKGSDYYKDGLWHHLAFTLDGLSTRIWIDGQRQPLTFSSSGPSVSANEQWIIGDYALAYPGLYPLIGDIGDVKVCPEYAWIERDVLNLNQRFVSTVGTSYTWQVGDDSGNRNMLIPKGGVTRVTGRSGYAMRFNGTTGHAIGVLDGFTDNITVGFFENLTAFTATQKMIWESSSDSSTTTGAIQVSGQLVSGANRVRVRVKTASGTLGGYYDLPTIGQHSFASQYDQAITSNAALRLYVDGAEVVLTYDFPYSGAGTLPVIYNGPFYLHSRAGTSLFADGWMDDLRIDSRILSPQEIQATSAMLLPTPAVHVPIYLGEANADPTIAGLGDFYLHTTSLTIGLGDSKIRTYNGTSWVDVLNPTSDQVSAAQTDILNQARFLNGTFTNVGQLSTFSRIFAQSITMAVGGSLQASDGSWSIAGDGTITAVKGLIAGWTLAATTLTGDNIVLNKAGDISVGSANNIVRLSSTDATYSLWAGHATAGSAPFRVSKAGAVTATAGAIGGWTLGATSLLSGSAGTTVGIDSGGTNPAFYAGSATPGSAPFRVTNAGVVTAVSGTIGGFTLGASTFSATNLVLTAGAANTANITVGTGATAGGLNSAATGGDITLWSGSTFANRATAPFNVTAAGALTATSGTIAAWALSATSLDSDAAGTARIKLDKTNNRVSVMNSSDTEVTSMGYLGGLLKNGSPWTATKTYAIGDYVNVSGVTYKATDASLNQTPPNVTYWVVSTDTWTTSDYGFWTKAGQQLKIDGDVSYSNGDWIVAQDASYLIKQGATTVVRLGMMAGNNGLWINEMLTGANFRLRLTTADFFIGNDTQNLTYSGGNLSVTGAVTSTSGIIGGWTLGATSLLSGSGSTTVGLDSGGTNPAFYAGSATPGSAPFRVTNAGALTATNATITGTVTATGGSIGGFTIGSNTISATNLILTAGAANTANIFVGLSGSGAGLGSPAVGTDIAIWAGSSFGGRATAPFRVTADGAVKLVVISSMTDGALNVTTASGNPGIKINTSGSDVGIRIMRAGTGAGSGIYIDNEASSAIGVEIANTNGYGARITNNSVGIGLQIISSSSSYGVHLSNTSTGYGLFVNSTSTGIGLKVTGPGVVLPLTTATSTATAEEGLMHFKNSGGVYTIQAYINGAWRSVTLT